MMISPNDEPSLLSVVHLELAQMITQANLWREPMHDLRAGHVTFYTQRP